MSARIRRCHPDARMHVGVLFRLLALKVPARTLKGWLDWQGVVENFHWLRDYGRQEGVRQERERARRNG